MKKFIMYGAGNIGRGFIGQVMSDNGFSVGFIDINAELIDRLNKDKCYPVSVVDNDGKTDVVVKNAYGIDGKNIELVASEIAACDLMATAIGVNVLKFIAKPIAEGLKKRLADKNSKPLNIIICENLLHADKFLRELLLKELPAGMHADFEKKIGLIEASIGRMVPAITEDKKEGNPLRIFVEPYNYLPVDKEAVKGTLPDIKQLYPYAPFSLFIERKLFMHNMSHAITAYLGWLYNDEYIWQAVARPEVRLIAYNAQVISARALSKQHKADINMLIDHGENLLYRFQNKALGDTVERVGKDTIRKLKNIDRLIGALNLSIKQGVPNLFICAGVAAALCFNPESDKESCEVYACAKSEGVAAALKKYGEFESVKELKHIETVYSMLCKKQPLSDVIEYCDKENNRIMKV